MSHSASCFRPPPPPLKGNFRKQLELNFDDAYAENTWKLICNPLVTYEEKKRKQGDMAVRKRQRDEAQQNEKEGKRKCNEESKGCNRIHKNSKKDMGKSKAWRKSENGYRNRVNSTTKRNLRSNC